LSESNQVFAAVKAGRKQPPRLALGSGSISCTCAAPRARKLLHATPHQRLLVLLRRKSKQDKRLRQNLGNGP
jgi:hypothetical protein